jgi:hypothetical protein
MRKLIAFVLIASISFLCLFSCDGGDGNSEGEFTVFDRIVNIHEIEGLVAECPENVFLKLSLILDENEISGYAQLFGFDKLGQRVEISGILEDDFFSLEEFEVVVLGPRGHHGRSSLRLSFSEFEGVLLSNVEDESVSGMEGNVAGDDIFYNLGDAVFCSGKFSGEFRGEAKIPEGS